jgi:hypothetical protein
MIPTCFVPCHFMLRASPVHDMSCNFTFCHDMSSHLKACHLMTFNITSDYDTSYHAVSCHELGHIMSCLRAPTPSSPKLKLHIFGHEGAKAHEGEDDEDGGEEVPHVELVGE